MAEPGEIVRVEAGRMTPVIGHRPGCPDGLVCKHGSLRRSCEICERDEENAKLRAEVARLKKALRDKIAELERESLEHWSKECRYLPGDAWCSSCEKRDYAVEVLKELVAQPEEKPAKPERATCRCKNPDPEKPLALSAPISCRRCGQRIAAQPTAPAGG